MRYYATASGPRVREAMRDGQLGHIATPASGHRLQAGVAWCADNGAFTGAYPGDDKYLAWLSARTAHVARCAFAAAPDVVADGAATLTRSLPMLERIRALGYPAALVALSRRRTTFSGAARGLGPERLANLGNMSPRPSIFHSTTGTAACSSLVTGVDRCGRFAGGGSPRCQ